MDCLVILFFLILNDIEASCMRSSVTFLQEDRKLQIQKMILNWKKLSQDKKVYFHSLEWFLVPSA